MLRSSILNRLNTKLNTSSIWQCFAYTTQSAAPVETPSPISNKKKPESLFEDDKKLKENLTFAKMFKQSKFVALGDLENKYLIGKIVDVVGDDLYVDYGGKFNCVVKRPERFGNNYVRNTNVKIKLISFEMASYFLNAAKHITLLESDAELVGTLRKDSEQEQDERARLTKKEIDELNAEPYY